ncbi:Hsp20/alpha crystallin family protein [Aliikangiella sp. G2MR2-5]|uniref:Hsp20/alpha crystallin family protein n=1 Tax=Aliikangiella sp. G2MR2-5 TaxID=2788943 RepID=UPI0018AC559C|nr:Hsp20/alpha crystallin family protein [Aliikangiella sp. G2MR2-5]
MNLVNFNPFKELDSWLNTYNQSLATGGQKGSSDWQPRVDITENEEAFVIKAELAGVPKDDIKVSLDNNILSISGERKSEIEDKKHHRIERFYGSFSRSFSLPENVNANAIKAENRDGVLILSLPKVEPEKQVKQIEIH